MSFFGDANLIFPSGDNDINSWADYCELFCVLSENKSQTIEELKDRLLDQYTMDYEDARNALRLTTTTTGRFIVSAMDILPFGETEQALDQENDFPDVNEGQRGNDSMMEDEIKSEFLFLFRFLEGRIALFGDSYPFRIDIKQNRISIDINSLTNSQKLYIALFLSANLRIYNSGIRNQLGHIFERLTLYPFKKMIAGHSRIEFFGAGAGHGVTPLFNGSFANRVDVLANALHCDTTTNFKKNIHDYTHSGDGGLDWVAWVPFQDDKSKMPVFFAQCACGNDWIDKEWDAHEDKWTRLLQLEDSYLTFHFVTKSFRKQDGDWYKPGVIFKLVLVDRARILSSIKDEDLEPAINLYEDLLNEAFQLNLSPLD